MDKPFDSRVDSAFVRALDHFIRMNGLSETAFCRRTEKFSEEGTKLILPTQVYKWRHLVMPSSRAAMITAATFGVPRSYFYLIGELLEGGQPLPEIGSDLVVQRLAVLHAAIRTAHTNDLGILGAALRSRLRSGPTPSSDREAGRLLSDVRIDRAFLASLDLHLRIHGWSAKAFCRQTARWSEDAQTKLLLPTMIVKWRRDIMPSAKATMITAATFGIPRSLFYLAGELLEAGEVPEVGSENEQVAVYQAATRGASTQDRKLLKEAIRQRRDELAHRRTSEGRTAYTRMTSTVS